MPLPVQAAAGTARRSRHSAYVPLGPASFEDPTTSPSSSATRSKASGSGTSNHDDHISSRRAAWSASRYASSIRPRYASARTRRAPPRSREHPPVLAFDLDRHRSVPRRAPAGAADRRCTRWTRPPRGLDDVLAHPDGRHSRSPLDMSISTRTTAPVPTLRVSTRTRKSSSSMSSSCGYSSAAPCAARCRARRPALFPSALLDVTRALGRHLRPSPRRSRLSPSPTRSSTCTR